MTWMSLRYFKSAVMLIMARMQGLATGMLIIPRVIVIVISQRSFLIRRLPTLQWTYTCATTTA